MNNGFTNDYKVEQLRIMRNYEQRQPENEQYGAHLTHWSGAAHPINLDAEALSVLIRHYSGEKQSTFGAPQMLTFAVNNQGTLQFTQSLHDHAVVVTRTEHNGASGHVDIIPPGEFVMLLNFWRHVKMYDIRNDFINPNGKNREEA